MKLWVFSDLHLDHTPLEEPLAVPEADVAVVAGDLGGGGLSPAVRWLERHVLPHMPCVFVPGNHEFYGVDMRGELENLFQARRRGGLPEGLHLLDREAVDLGGVRFLGCTLWTDFALHGDGDRDLAHAMYDASYHLNDYRMVRWGMETLRPERTRELHLQARAWLEGQLKGEHAGPAVVVSHHAPSPWSVHMRYRESTLNPAFASDLGDLLKVWGPDLWAHGHVHDSFDYVLGETRVLCNPRGYGRENHAFDLGMVVEV